jgi:HSF-type DNA-binding
MLLQDDRSSMKRIKTEVTADSFCEADHVANKQESNEPAMKHDIIDPNNKHEGKGDANGNSSDFVQKAELTTEKGNEDDGSEGAKTQQASTEHSSAAVQVPEDGDRTLDSGFMSFPEKIMMLLTKNMVKDAMWWLPDGDAFCILPAPFTEKVLDQHFQGTKFESFTRKLNRWGFKRVAGDGIPANAIAFYHNFFQKDRPELLKDMSGGKSKNASNNQKKSKGKIDTHHSDHKSTSLDKKGQVGASPIIHNKRDQSTGSSADVALGSSSFRDGVRGSVDPMVLRREILAQQLGSGLDPALNDSLLLEQILRARGASQLAGDSLRTAELDKIISSTETARLLGQQRDSLLQSNMAADNTRLLLQQLASSNSSDLAARLLAQRPGGLGPYGSNASTTSLLEQMRASQVNTDTELALRILAQQRGRGEVSSNGFAAALARQHLGGADSFGLGGGDLQSRYLLERLRASQGRDSSIEVLNRLMSSSGEGGSSLYDSADVRSRLLNTSLANPRLAHLLQSEPNLSDQQIYELLLMQQQRDGLSRLGGDVGTGGSLDR